MDPQLIRDYFYRFLYQPQDREYPDLCQLPDLNEQTLLDNLRARFLAGHIYTYVGSILIAVNPFKVKYNNNLLSFSLVKYYSIHLAGDLFGLVNNIEFIWIGYILNTVNCLHIL